MFTIQRIIELAKQGRKYLCWDKEGIPEEPLKIKSKKKGLGEYIINDGAENFILDYNKLSELSDEEFRRIHLEQNEIDFLKYKSKYRKDDVNCSDCPNIISESKYSIKYAGGFHHVYCFRLKYNVELKDRLNERDKLESNYLERLINVLDKK